MKKTYFISIISRKVQIKTKRDRMIIDYIRAKAAITEDNAFWASPEGIRCQQAERLWRNLADSEIPVSGRVVIRLIEILDRANDGARKRKYPRVFPPYELRSSAPVGGTSRAQYVLWAAPIWGRNWCNLGIRRV